MAATTIDMSQFIATKPTAQPTANQLPPKNSATLWVVANPFVQTVAHFAVAFGLGVVIVVLCYFVIEPAYPGFFPLSGLITDSIFLFPLVLGVRISVDRSNVKEKALNNLAGFCSSLQAAILHSSTNLTTDDIMVLSEIPQRYLLCLRAKSEGGNPNTSDTTIKTQLKVSNWQLQMYKTAEYCKSKGIDMSMCLQFYENATLSECFTTSRDLNGFVWVCTWIYCGLVPFVFWGLYRGWWVVFGIFPIWATIALAHGFTRNMHLYGLYRKHAATPFDLMQYAIEQSTLLRAVLNNKDS